MPKRTPLAVGLAAALIGVAVLGRALLGATPVVFFGTPEERAAIDAGRELLPWAALVLALAATPLVVSGRRIVALLVVLPGIVCPLLVLGQPSTLFAWLAFAALAPAAVFSALGALLAPDPGDGLVSPS
jgi:hypothetical protein